MGCENGAIFANTVADSEVGAQQRWHAVLISRLEQRRRGGVKATRQCANRGRII
jgi:hypothetical protein